MLLGLALIAGPLLVAVVDAAIQIRSLARTSQQLVLEGVQSARLTRSLTNNLSAAVSISGLRARSSAPVLPEWGSLYWAPEYYVEPGLGLAYNTPLSGGFSLGAGAHMGYAFMRERLGAQRFQGTGVPVFGGTLDLRYHTGPWSFDLSAGYGGAVTEGYRAGSLRLQATYKTGR